MGPHAGSRGIPRALFGVSPSATWGPTGSHAGSHGGHRLSMVASQRELARALEASIGGPTTYELRLGPTWTPSGSHAGAHGRQGAALSQSGLVLGPNGVLRGFLRPATPAPTILTAFHWKCRKASSRELQWALVRVPRPQRRALFGVPRGPLEPERVLAGSIANFRRLPRRPTTRAPTRTPTPTPVVVTRLTCEI